VLFDQGLHSSISPLRVRSALKDGRDRVIRRLRFNHATNAVRWVLNYRGQRAAIGRGYAFDALSRVTPSVAVDTDGLRLYVSTSDQVVSRATFSSRTTWEGEQFPPLMDALQGAGMGAGIEGRGFLDIGGNIGSATCLALSRYGATEAWIFEPSPVNVRLLRQNMLANGLENRVHVHAVALSDHDGMTTLELSDENWGDNRVRVESANGDRSPGVAGEAQRRTVDVAARRLDSLVEDGSIDLDSIGLAWIDVQGHEAHVLAGAVNLLDSNVPIVCEYWPYGLKRAGGLERFHALVAGSRTRFIDLSAPDPTVLRIDQLSALQTKYTGLTCTDLLVLP